MQTDNIKAFKRLFVPVEQSIFEYESHVAANGVDEQMMEQIIANCDTLISMLPMEFPTQSAHSPGQRIMLINLADPDDEPAESLEIDEMVHENIRLLHEHTILANLEYWRFSTWNTALHYTKDALFKEKYTPLMLAQAAHNMQRFPHGSYWDRWEKNFYVQYTNQIGWYAYELDEDTAKLEAALTELKKGYELSDWHSLSYIKDTTVRLLLKLNRPDEAYPIVREALIWNADFEYFQDLKNDSTYLLWIKEDAKRTKKARQAFLKMVKSEQEKVTNQFTNPQHPLVLQHADTLNLVKQRMVSLTLHQKYKEDWVTLEDDYDEEAYALEKWSVEKIAKFEKETKLRLPDELKVYLMEIGEGGDRFFTYDGIYINWLAEDKKEQKRVKKPFPVTADKIHDIDHWWGVKAWVYPDDEEWIEIGKFTEDDDMEELFELPAAATLLDGTIKIGDSSSQDPLYLIMNGEFEGEVWVDTLQYGADAGGCFAPASAGKLKFLAYIAECILAQEQWHKKPSDQGNWK